MTAGTGVGAGKALAGADIEDQGWLAAVAVVAAGSGC